MKASLSHPEAETMAAYLDGKLPRDEATAVTEHLADCLECRVIAGEAARFRREEGLDVQPQLPVRNPLSWWLSAAAAVIVVGVAVLLVSPRFRLSHPRDILADSSARNGRVIEMRLADFRWSRLKEQRSVAGADRAQVKLRGDAANVLDLVQGQTSPDALHTSGVAHLLMGDIDQAVIDLERASRGSRDPAVWNDLAVARDAAATRGRPSEYSEALAAADRALLLKPEFAEASFNRALILEQMGLTRQAIAQWEAYLRLDPSSPWATEASGHLQRLRQAVRGSDFPRALERASVAFAAGNNSPLDDLVRSFPQEARTSGEGLLLARWADALQRNDEASTRRSLDVVRHIAEQLAGSNGERLLGDAVAAIDGARDDPARLDLLARGHALYHSARSRQQNEPAAAERDLKTAADFFRRADSPMEQLTMRYAASMAFDQNRITEARAIFLGLAARCDRARHRALDASVASQLTRCDGFAGDWTAALQDALHATEVFESLGEHGNAVWMLSSVAGAYDHVGDAERAWKLWVTSMNGPQNHGAAVTNAVRSCIRNHLYDGAIALAQAAVEDLRGPNDALLRSDVLIQRARAAAESGQEAAAMIGEAQVAAAALSDAAQRERAEADLMIVQGVAARRANPVASVALLSRAIDFYRDRQYGPWLIEALFQRGRSYVAAAQPSAALDDFQRAVDGMEQQRATIAAIPSRQRFFDIEPELFEDTVALRLQQHDVAGAFAYADRSRARALRDKMGAAVLPSVREIQTALPAGTAILEYAFIPSGLAIFCITPASLTVFPVQVDRAALRTQISDFREAIERDEEIDNVDGRGRRLYDLLIAPVRAPLVGMTDVVIVADRDLQSVPYAALADGATGRHLIEELAISFAPSASLAAHQPAHHGGGRSLFVGDPATADSDPLPGAAREAEALGRRHSDSVILTRQQATRARFLEEAPKAQRIHYAGHARPEGAGPAALLLAGAGADSLLDAGEIARLHLPATELVVVAGCSTARGPTRQMEGVPSLAGAFIAAGAPVVVATLWDIDDGLTSPLFTAFHAAISDGVTPARALQKAQIAALTSPDALERRPFTWGGVVVVRATQ